MRYGVNIFIWSADYNEAVAELFPRLKASGFDGVEVPVFRPREFQSAHLRHRKVCDDEISILAPALSCLVP